ncbi:MAG: pantetheine-phosphate adenylyltransferase [Firmicutes bacterium]|nr:pantetheine-phosphate adenylyltransferase [Bacillota bacterium]
MNAVYPGSFDPFTLGHQDIVRRAAALFGRVFVAVAEDTGKQTADLTARVELARLSLAHIPNVTVMGYDGLTTDFAIDNKCGVIVRGLRDNSDILYEKTLYHGYKKLAAQKNTDIEIVYLISHLPHVSSTAVRRLIKECKDVKEYISETILEKVINLYKPTIK